MEIEEALRRILSAMLKLADHNAVELPPLLQMVEIPVAILSKKDYYDDTLSFSFSQFARLHVLIKSAANDESHGYDEAKAPIGNASLVAKLISSSETLYKAHVDVNKCMHLFQGNMSSYRIENDEALNYYGFERKHYAEDIDNELLILNDAAHLYWWYRTSEWLIGEAIKLDHVGVMGQSEQAHAVCTALFKCAVKSEQSFNYFAFDSALGDRIIVRSFDDPESLGQNAGQFLSAFSENVNQPFYERVKQLMAKGNLTIEEVAEKLHCAPITVRRRLAKENTSFQKLKDEYRKSMALHLLADPRITIAEVSCRVGFSDSAGFYKAVKKWTGQTPTELRSMQPPVGV